MTTLAPRRRVHEDSSRITWHERLRELHRIYSGVAQRAEVRNTMIGFDPDPSTASGRKETYVITRYAPQGARRG